ncbi:Cholinesterase [Lachnellula suecica]|uniref:Carboxylic ester hydrolase n=1 Tax=Lachnellula suecica TaxID=602035 RepID=A0A8T9CKQ7_9HELO|nr:Cholinesterase [Lachnellula suecica]
MKTSSYLLSLALCAGNAVQAANWTVGQVVQTSSGQVTGHAAFPNVGVSEYLGIPFAVPPVDDLRWTAPVKYNGTSDINGTTFGFSCPAAPQVTPSLEKLAATNVTSSGLQILEQLGQIGDKFSEDCLTLNVWTKPQVGEAKKAVLVWIYGGAFTTGSSDNLGYNGQNIAEQEDVVLVSFNYRLGVLGFPGSPNGTQNLGLLDQRLAVEWVRDNVASFGGDPSRITLFGQSAGSASVDYYSYAWVEDPIVHSFIEESGSTFGPAGGLGAITSAAAETYWQNLTTTLGCGNSSSDEASALACLKAKSYTDVLQAAAASATNSGSGLSTSFGPTVDDVVVFANYTQRSLAGNFAKLPLLLGTADYEAGLFKVLSAFENITMSDAYWFLFDDVAFTCPCATRANVSISNDVPTWRYRWFGSFPNTEITTIPYSGAWHASELPALFGTFPSGSGVPNSTAEELEIASYIRGAWATFAKNPTDGLSTYQGGWPTYSPADVTLARIGYNNMTGANLARGNEYDGACSQIVSGNVVSGSSGNSSSPSDTSSTSTAPTASNLAPVGTVTTSSAELSRIQPLVTLALFAIAAMVLASS